MTPIRPNRSPPSHPSISILLSLCSSVSKFDLNRNSNFDSPPIRSQIPLREPSIRISQRKSRRFPTQIPCKDRFLPPRNPNNPPSFTMGATRVCRGITSHHPSSSSSSSWSPHPPQPPMETASTSVTETVNGSHEFKITGYSLLKGLGIGKYMTSDIFEVGGYQWAIYFYPDGKSAEDNAAYVSLFIALASEGTDVRALFELTMMDQSGKEQHKVHSHFGRNLEGGPYTLKYRGSMWGYKRFFKRTALEVSDYLKDDCLSVCCTVGVVKSNTEGPKIFTIQVPPSNIAQHFGKVLESGIGTDVRFEVEGETFAAHKLVLATRSPVFRAQLFGPMKDRNMESIKVEDMEPPVFKALLHFIYWDTLPDLEELADTNATWVSTIMAQHLLAAADRYCLERLRLLCEVMLCENVVINTVANSLVLAEQHRCPQLKSVCLKYVTLPENLRAVMQTDGFAHLKLCCPSVMTELLQHVARAEEHAAISYVHTIEAFDGSDATGRRVKPRILH